MIGAPCDCCPLGPSRRDFLRHTSLAAIGALVMVGIPPELAATMRPTAVTGRISGRAMLSYPIPAGDGVQIDKKNQVILVRWQNEMYAFNLSCPHQNTALHWEQSHSEFQCPKHHSRYRPDGTFIDGRATRNMDRFTVARSGNEISVNVDQMHKSDADRSGWAASVVQLSGTE
jgi:Rieske Fe-S protein